MSFLWSFLVSYRFSSPFSITPRALQETSPSKGWRGTSEHRSLTYRQKRISGHVDATYFWTLWSCSGVVGIVAASPSSITVRSESMTKKMLLTSKNHEAVRRPAQCITQPQTSGGFGELGYSRPSRSGCRLLCDSSIFFRCLFRCLFLVVW